MVLGVIASLAGLIAQQQAQAQQAQIARENLDFQKHEADREYDLATADREDAYGNSTGYNDLLKKWEMNLAPQQKKLVKSGEREQLLSLTEDAGRSRDLRRRQEGRSREAEDVYNDLLADYQYDQPDSEDEIFNRILGDVAGMRTEAGNAAKNALGGAAARLGKGGSVSDLLQKAVGGAGSNDVIQARDMARKESGEREQVHRGKLQDLGVFEGIMDDINDAPIRFSNTPEKMDGTQSDMLRAIAGAITGGASRVGQAYGQLGQTMQAPDFSSLASSLNGLKLGLGARVGGGTGTATGAATATGTPMLSGANAPLWSGPTFEQGYPYDFDTDLDSDLDYTTF